MVGKIKAHQLKEEHIEYIKAEGGGGRNGYLLKLIPLKEDAVSPNLSSRILEELYGASRADFKIGSKYTKHHLAFEFWLEDSKITTYFWTNYKEYRERAWHQFQAGYPGMHFEHEREKYFINLKERDWVACARFKASSTIMPLEILEGDCNWVPILSAMSTEDKQQRAVIQLLIAPMRSGRYRSKADRLASALKGGTYSKDGRLLPAHERDLKLSEQLAKKARQEHFWCELRVVCVGPDKHDTIRKLQEMLGMFEQFNSKSGGKKLIRITENIRWLKFLNAVEDRDMEHYINPLDYRIYLSTDELGHNFFTLPTKSPIPSQYTHNTAQIFPRDKKIKELLETASATQNVEKIPLLIPDIGDTKPEHDSSKTTKQNNNFNMGVNPLHYIPSNCEVLPEFTKWKGIWQERIRKGSMLNDDEWKQFIKTVDKQTKILYAYYKVHPDEKPLLEHRAKASEYYEAVEKTSWFLQMQENAKRNLVFFGDAVDPTTLERSPVALLMNHFIYHMFILGGSGAGKSNLLGIMAIQAIAAGHNVIIFDPHGDHQKNILRYFSEEIADKWINIDPADILPVGTNALHYALREKLAAEGRTAEVEKLDSIRVNNIIGTFKRYWGEQAVGPQAQDVLTTTLRHGIEIPGFTLVDAAFVLRRPEFAYRFVTRSGKESLRTFFQYEMPNLDYRQLTSSINKLKAFSENPILRHTFCCRDSPIILDDLIAPGKVVFVNVNIQELGEETSRILGAIMLAQIWSAVVGKKKPNDPNEFETIIILDEFQNFAPYNFGDVQSGARKYNTGLILATQYLDQLTEDMRASVKNNVGSVFCLKVGPDDAAEMAKWLGCRPIDIQERNLYEAVARLKVETEQNKVETTSPMTIFIYPPIPYPEGYQERIEELKRISREKYGRLPISRVESIFAGIVQDLHDFLAALRALQLQTEKEWFSETDIKLKMENLAHQTISFPDLEALFEYAIESKYIEAKDEKIVRRRDGIKMRKGLYKLSSYGLEYLKIKTGKGPIAGYEKHEWLLSRATEFFLKKNVKMRVLQQSGGTGLPDAEILVAYNTEGLTAAEAAELEEKLKDTWIYKFGNGRDINAEAVSTTLEKPQGIQADLAKGISANRLVLWLVESEEEANKLGKIAERLITDPAYCVIAPNKPHSTTTFIRQPNVDDYKIFVVNEQEVKEIIAPNQFRAIKSIDIPTMNEQGIEVWKTLLPVCEKLVKTRDIDKFGIIELIEECTKINRNISPEGIVHTIEQTKITIDKTGDDYRYWVCTITPGALKTAQAILEDAKALQKLRAEEERTEVKMFSTVVKTLRKRLRKYNMAEETFEGETDIARKTNVPLWQISEALKQLNIKPNGGGKITITYKQLGEESVLQLTKELFGDDEFWQDNEQVENTIKGICLEDYRKEEREKEIGEWLDAVHICGDGSELKIETKEHNGKKYWIIKTRDLNRISEQEIQLAPRVKEVDWISYYKQYVKLPWETMFIEHAKVKAEFGEQEFKKHLKKAKELVFEINDKGVCVVGNRLYKEERETEEQKEVAEHAEKLESREEVEVEKNEIYTTLPAKCYFCNKELQKQTECTLSKNYGYVCLECFNEKVCKKPLSEKDFVPSGEKAKESQEELKVKITEQLIDYLINTKKTKEGVSVNITCEEVFKALNIQNSEKKVMRELIESKGMMMHNLGMPGYYQIKLADLTKEKEGLEPQESKRGRPKADVDKEKIIQLKGEGKSLREIAKEVRISKDVVAKILKEVGLSDSKEESDKEE